MADKNIYTMEQVVNVLATMLVELDTGGVNGTSGWAYLSQIMALMLGGRTIGGSAATDIPTNNSAVELLNKTLITPIINSSGCTSDGADIDSTVAKVAAMLEGVTVNLQTQLDLKAPASIMEFLPKRLRLEFTTGSGVTYKTYTEANLLAAMALTGLYIDKGITLQLFFKDSGKWSRIDDSGYSYIITPAVNGITGQSHLDEFQLSSLTKNTEYMITMVLSVIGIVVSGS